MSFRRILNKFNFYSFKHVEFRAEIKSAFAGNFTMLLYLKLKHTKFLLRHTVLMICQKQHAENDLNASNVMILLLKIKKKMLWCTKNVDDEALHSLFYEDSCQMLTEVAESL